MNAKRIDSHAHGWIQPGVDDETTAARMREYRQDGIDKVILIAEPEDVLATAKRCPDFVVPVPFVDIDKITPKEIGVLFERGVKGIKFIAPDKSYGHDDYMPLYRAILDHGGAAVFHTGYLMVGFKGKVVDITLMRPAAIDRIVRVLPDLKILMGHFGNPWWEECWKIMSTHKNVYADLSGGTAFRKATRLWADMFAPDGVLEVASIAKLCFGSDLTYLGEKKPKYEVYIDFYERLFRAINAPAEIQAIVNRENMVRLFNL